jgi:hypothetical protein
MSEQLVRPAQPSRSRLRELSRDKGCREQDQSIQTTYCAESKAPGPNMPSTSFESM